MGFIQKDIFLHAILLLNKTPDLQNMHYTSQTRPIALVFLLCDCAEKCSVHPKIRFSAVNVTRGVGE